MLICHPAFYGTLERILSRCVMTVKISPVWKPDVCQLWFNYLYVKLETVCFKNIISSKQVYKYMKMKAYLKHVGNDIRTLCRGF